MLNVKGGGFQGRIFRLWSDVVDEYEFEIFGVVESDIYTTACGGCDSYSATVGIQTQPHDEGRAKSRELAICGLKQVPSMNEGPTLQLWANAKST